MKAAVFAVARRCMGTGFGIRIKFALFWVLLAVCSCCPTRQCWHTSMILPRCTGKPVLPASTGKLVSGSLLRLLPPQAGGWVGRREAVAGGMQRTTP